MEDKKESVTLVVTADGRIMLLDDTTVDDLKDMKDVTGIECTDAVLSTVANYFLHRMIEVKNPFQEMIIPLNDSDVYMLLSGELRPVSELDETSHFCKTVQ